MKDIPMNKELYAYLLSNKSGTELLDLLLPNLPKEVLDKLIEEVNSMSKKYEVDYTKVHDDCTSDGQDDNNIWT